MLRSKKVTPPFAIDQSIDRIVYVKGWFQPACSKKFTTPCNLEARDYIVVYLLVGFVITLDGFVKIKLKSYLCCVEEIKSYPFSYMHVSNMYEWLVQRIRVHVI